MRFIAFVAVLAVCLIQGNNAELISALRNRLSTHLSNTASVVNAASNAIRVSETEKNITAAAKSAVGSAVNAVDATAVNLRERLSDEAKKAADAAKAAAVKLGTQELAVEVGTITAGAEFDEILKLALNGQASNGVTLEIDETITIKEEILPAVSAKADGSIVSRLRERTSGLRSLVSGKNSADAKAPAKSTDAKIPAKNADAKAPAKSADAPKPSSLLSGLRNRLPSGLSERITETISIDVTAEAGKAPAKGKDSPAKDKNDSPAKDKDAPKPSGLLGGLRNRLPGGLRERITETISIDVHGEAGKDSPAKGKDSPAKDKDAPKPSGLLGGLRKHIHERISIDVHAEASKAPAASKDSPAKSKDTPAKKADDDKKPAKYELPSYQTGIRGLLSGALNLAGNAASGAKNVASDAASGAWNTASKVINTAQKAAKSTIDTIRSKLSIDASAVLDVASSGKLTELELDVHISKLGGSDLLDIIKGAGAEISTLAKFAQIELSEAIAAGRKNVIETVEDITRGWSTEISEIVAKATKAGTDVSGCAVESVAELAKGTATSAIKCITDKIVEGVDLGKKMTTVVNKSAALSKSGTELYEACETKDTLGLRITCHASHVAPIALEAALLGGEAAKIASDASYLVGTFEGQLKVCAGKVAASKALEAVVLSGEVVECVKAKIAAAA